MNNIEVRPVTQHDAPFLHLLMNNEQVMTTLNEVPTAVEVWAAAIPEWNSDPDEEDYIICDDGMPIGWLGINELTSAQKRVFIKVIALLPTHQGRGIGQCVMHDMIAHLRIRGYSSLGLYTDCDNERAQHCYRKCGFEVSKTTEQRMSNGTTVQRYRMERSL